MSERIRNALFNSIGPEVQGAVVLDAFAGTGAIGLEALSRGADRAVFVEKDRVAQKILTENIHPLDANNTTEVIKHTSQIGSRHIRGKTSILSLPTHPIMIRSFPQLSAYLGY